MGPTCGLQEYYRRCDGPHLILKAVLQEVLWAQLVAYRSITGGVMGPTCCLQEYYRRFDGPNLMLTGVLQEV